MTNTIRGSDSVDKKYLARCVAQLKKWNAPLTDWYRVDWVDVREDDEDAPLSECDLCGCKRVRYEHHMRHAGFPLTVVTGCICAGIMQGDILEAQETERRMRNRSKRRRAFAKKPWKAENDNLFMRRYKGRRIMAERSDGLYTVTVEGGPSAVGRYKGRPIDNLLSAAYAAFDIIDPVSEVRNAGKRS